MKPGRRPGFFYSRIWRDKSGGGELLAMEEVENMVVQLEEQGLALVARLTGEIDLQVTDGLRSALDDALGEKGVRHLVLDLSGVGLIDSTGLGVILGRYRRLAQSGGRVSLVGLQPLVRRVMELSGLLRIMREYASENEALAGLDQA